MTPTGTWLRNVQCWSMRKRRIKKRQRVVKQAAQLANESTGQLLSPEEQEKAALRRIISEMRHHGGRKGAHAKREPRRPEPPSR